MIFNEIFNKMIMKWFALIFDCKNSFLILYINRRKASGTSHSISVPIVISWDVINFILIELYEEVHHNLFLGLTLRIFGILDVRYLLHY